MLRQSRILRRHRHPLKKPRAPRPTKLRPIAIGVMVVGLIVLVGGFAKFIPGGKTTGAAIAFLGVCANGIQLYSSAGNSRSGRAAFFLRQSHRNLLRAVASVSQSPRLIHIGSERSR